MFIDLKIKRNESNQNFLKQNKHKFVFTIRVYRREKAEGKKTKKLKP